MKVKDIKPFIFGCHEIFICTAQGIIFNGRMSDINTDLLNREIINISAYNDIISILVWEDKNENN